MAAREQLFLCCREVVVTLCLAMRLRHAVVIQRCFDEAVENRVWIIGLAAEFGVELASDKERMRRQFDRLG